MIDEMVMGGMLLPLAIGIIEIHHRRSRDVILVRVEADTLQAADLSGALLLGADLTGMRCTGASFRHARLMRACLIEADLAAADFCGADLRGADLRGADLTGARYDRNTLWPAQFDPTLYGAIEAPTGDE